MLKLELLVTGVSSRALSFLVALKSLVSHLQLLACYLCNFYPFQFQTTANFLVDDKVCPLDHGDTSHITIAFCMVDDNVFQVKSNSHQNLIQMNKNCHLKYTVNLNLMIHYLKKNCSWN